MGVRERLRRALWPGAGALDRGVVAESSKNDDWPIGFGYKSAWVAIRSTETQDVIAALPLQDAAEHSWTGALETVERKPDRTMVSPPVAGWSLVAFNGGRAKDGHPILDLEALSRRFGEAQQFATHRVVEYHEWQRWVDGRLVRRYAYSGERGEVLADDGEPDPAEGGVISRAQLESLQDSGDEADWDDVEFADEDTVMAVAAAWSVDPSTRDDRSDIKGRPLLGTYRR